MSKSACQVL